MYATMAWSCIGWHKTRKLHGIAKTISLDLKDNNSLYETIFTNRNFRKTILQVMHLKILFSSYFSTLKVFREKKNAIVKRLS